MDKVLAAKINFYKVRIKNDRMTIDEVPEEYRQYLIEPHEEEPLTWDEITSDDFTL